MAIQTGPSCPSCAQLDSVRKVTSIVSEGTLVGQYEDSAPVQWQGKTYWIPVQKSTAFSTVLAQRLAPPAQPKKPIKKNPTSPVFFTAGLTILVVIFWAIVGIVLEPALGLEHGGLNRLLEDRLGPLSIVCSLLCVSITGGVLGWVILRAFPSLGTKLQQDNQHAMAQYQAELRLYERYPIAIKRWRQLYYCSRCDVVFIPGEGRFAPIEKMYSYLYD